MTRRPTVPPYYSYGSRLVLLVASIREDLNREKMKYKSAIRLGRPSGPLPQRLEVPTESLERELMKSYVALYGGARFGSFRYERLRRDFAGSLRFIFFIQSR